MKVAAHCEPLEAPMSQADDSKKSAEDTFLQKVEGSVMSATDVDWVPPVDILANSKEYLFRADLPEMEPKDVHVLVERDVLFISGERKFQKVDQDEKHLRLERPHGYFVRRFALPDDASRVKFSAAFKKGVLEVHVHRVPAHTIEKAHPQQTIVKVAS